VPIDLTVDGFVVSILALLAGYGIAYLRKRGENLATKQDIAEITRSVEEVKADFHVLSESELSSLSRQHDALVDFFDVATSLVIEKLPRSYADFKNDEGKGLREHLDAVEALFGRLLVTYHRLALYFSRDAEVVRTASEVVKAATQLRRDYAPRFIGAHIAIVNAVEQLSQGPDSQVDNDTVQQKVGDYVAAMVRPLERLRLAYDEHLRALNSYFLSRGKPDTFASVAGEGSAG
jgi:hypothetical protein